MNRQISFLLAFLLLLTSAGLACVVPVFRYALEKWEPDPYEVTVYHSKPLNEAQKKNLRQLAKSSYYADGVDVLGELKLDKVPVNVVVRLAKYNDSTHAKQVPDKGQLPWVRIDYPEHTFLKHPFWEGSLETMDVEKIYRSKARAELGERILKGETAVFMVLQTGDKAKDQAFKKRLAEYLKEMNKTVKLPDIAPEEMPGWFDPDNGPVMRVEFTQMDVPTGKEEALFRSMLVQAFPALKNLKEPAAVPVFGRGRALYPLLDSKMTKTTMNAACTFLAGMCTCTIKADNPGVDLLMATDWESFRGGSLVDVLEQPKLTGLSGIADPNAQAAPQFQPHQETPVEKVSIFKALTVASAVAPAPSPKKETAASKKETTASLAEAPSNPKPTAKVTEKAEEKAEAKPQKAETKPVAKPVTTVVSKEAAEKTQMEKVASATDNAKEERGDASPEKPMAKQMQDLKNPPSSPNRALAAAPTPAAEPSGKGTSEAAEASAQVAGVGISSSGFGRNMWILLGGLVLVALIGTFAMRGRDSSR